MSKKKKLLVVSIVMGLVAIAFKVVQLSITVDINDEDEEPTGI